MERLIRYSLPALRRLQLGYGIGWDGIPQGWIEFVQRWRRHKKLSSSL